MDGITVTEISAGRTLSSGDSVSAEIKYIVQGTSDDVEACGALAAIAPTVYDGLVRRTWSVKPVDIEAGWWAGTVQYGVGKRLVLPKTGDKVLTLDTSGGSMHITQSIQTLGIYGLGGIAALTEDFGGAIGVTHNSVEGCEVGIAQFNFAVTYLMPAEEVTAERIAAFYRLTNCVNGDGFSIECTKPPVTLTFAAHELLFLGVSGGPRSEDDYEFAFKFSASPNRTGITIGAIPDIPKDGWAYLWVRYADAVGSVSVIKKPVQVNVEQVYYTDDFGDLGLGVTTPPED